MVDVRDAARVGRRRLRLEHVDVDAIGADYEAGVVVRVICEQHRVGLSRLYHLLDERDVPRREPGHAQRTPEHVQDAIAAEYQAGVAVNVIAAGGATHGTRSELGMISRVGVATRVTGLRSIERVAPERRSDLAARIVAELRDHRW